MKKEVKFFIYFIIWALVPFVITFFIWAYQFAVFNPVEKTEVVTYFAIFVNNILISTTTTLIGAMGFYLTFKYITPSILNKRKKGLIILYFVILLAFPFLFIYLLSFVFNAIYWFFELFIIYSYIILIPFSIFGALLQVYQYWQTKNREKAELERQNIQTELALLKAKIDPHFLFNTINNIDVLIENNPMEASKYLKKLGKILRFTLYQTKENKILLAEEINYLNEYIELQKIRSINPRFIEFHIKGNPDNLRIAPMVFITFVENAFKFVLDKKIDSSIQIEIKISVNDITFTCKNTFDDKELKEKNKDGIGLSTIKKRLNLIYKNNYELKINTIKNQFVVILKIKL
ncbi:MAG: histidine kinase [Flavobacteriaceae bacterium]